MRDSNQGSKFPLYHKKLSQPSKLAVQHTLIPIVLSVYIEDEQSNVYCITPNMRRLLEDETLP